MIHFQFAGLLLTVAGLVGFIIGPWYVAALLLAVGMLVLAGSWR